MEVLYCLNRAKHFRGGLTIDIIGGREKEHVTLYLEKRVRVLLNAEAKGKKERYSTVVNRILWDALKGRYNFRGD